MPNSSESLSVPKLGIAALKVDLRRKRQHYTRVNNFVNKYIKMTLQWGSLAVMVFRLQQQCRLIEIRVLRWFLGVLVAIPAGLLRLLTDAYINPKANIGTGLVLHNFAGIEIDPESAGKNLTVNQNVCIGVDYEMSGRPTIGNNVFVGAGAKILGPVSIGDNVVIAANSLVVDSIPDCCSVVGCPAQIVSRGVTSDYLSFD
ncbi:DapH/DapD/GlmU-related protein [Paraglaciecola sp.]|uniref:serine O-acetyltransferase n=1 Tax=Paraglaciecola sp. TaxID=1920173 RepID=UPI003263955C